ncbi:unnamed protein product [Urochloa humidicola]
MEKDNTFISSRPQGIHGSGGGHQRRGGLRWRDAATACRRRRASRRTYASLRKTLIALRRWRDIRPPVITVALLPARHGGGGDGACPSPSPAERRVLIPEALALVDSGAEDRLLGSRRRFVVQRLLPPI